MTPDQIRALYRLSPHASMAEIAVQIGVSRNTYHQWCTGKGHPNRAHQRKLWALAARIHKTDTIRSLGGKRRSAMDEADEQLTDRLAEKLSVKLGLGK